MSSTDIVEALENCEFFKGMEKDEIEHIAGLCQVESFEAGEGVFTQGDFGEFLYIISEGHVFLERSMDLGTRKGNVVIGILGKGRVFGCWSALLDEPRNVMSSATCQRPTTVVKLEGSKLRELMLQRKDLGFNVLERLCFLLRDRIQGAYGAMEKI
ncbi:MAG: cyclic nucleotide-binding domain-containing protein [Pseudomonadota bacterium]